MKERVLLCTRQGPDAKIRQTASSYTEDDVLLGTCMPTNS